MCQRVKLLSLHFSKSLVSCRGLFFLPGKNDNPASSLQVRKKELQERFTLVVLLKRVKRANRSRCFLPKERQERFACLKEQIALSHFHSKKTSYSLKKKKQTSSLKDNSQPCRQHNRGCWTGQ